MKNYEWFVRADTSRYAGKWVAIADQKVAASGNDAQKVYLKAKRLFPKAKLSLAKVPDKQTLILLCRW